MSLVGFYKGAETKIKSLPSSSAVKEGVLYVATDTGTFWLGTSTNTLLQIKDNINTTYSAGSGISLSGTSFSNSGVRSIATGSSNGTLSVNTNGTSRDVAVKGLGSAAYTASTAYATADHNHDTVYAALNHNHDAVYAAKSHTHNYAGSSTGGGQQIVL